MRTFRIDVVAKILRIYTRIGGVFLLVKGLDKIQRHFGRIAVLAVAINL